MYSQEGRGRERIYREPQDGENPSSSSINESNGKTSPSKREENELLYPKKKWKGRSYLKEGRETGAGCRSPLLEKGGEGSKGGESEGGPNQ